MRERRLAYNEFVDEYGNVRKDRGTVYQHRGEGSSLIADFAVLILKSVWFVVRGICRLSVRIMKVGWKNLREV